MSLKDGKKKFCKVRRSASQSGGTRRSLQVRRRRRRREEYSNSEQDSVRMGRGSVTFNNMVDMLGSGEDGDGETEECDERVPLLCSR